MPEINLDNASNVLYWGLIYGGMILAAFWLAMIIWTYRDMRARSRDSVAQIVAALMVAVLTIPGLLIYLMLRPRETLSEAYERSLEEEALLQEIEEKPTCPGCKQRVDDEWQACPHCHTRLKKPCVRCGKMLELSWNLCPYCATAQQYASDHTTGYVHARPSSVPEGWTPVTESYDTASTSARSRSTLEFVEGEE